MKLFFHKTGSGQPLLILHGLFGMSDNWMSLSKQFAENGFECYTVDLRNHGRSPHSDEFNYGVMADDILELMNDHHIASADILGHSLGGKVAMFFATQNPGRTNKLIVADIAPRYYAPHHDSIIAALHAVDLDSITSRKEAEAQLRISLKDEGTVQFLLKNLYWEEKGAGMEKKLAWRFNLRAIEKNIDAVGEAVPEDALFQKPVLFVRGEKSGYITTDDEPLIRKHFPIVELKTIPNAGHWVHAENPKGFMEVVLGFLKSDQPIK
jgi:pimeloyl-ACP methyl ester carboxylesterase